MAEHNLNDEQISGLTEVIEKIKKSKNYLNYVSGVKSVSKKAQGLQVDGDVFAGVGEALKTGDYPSYLKDVAKGQEKVQSTLVAELKQKRMHGLLKDEDLKNAVYGELFVKQGTLDTYMGKSIQEEQMVEDVKQDEAEVAPVAAENDAAGAESGDIGTEELYDLPDYGEEFYQTDAFKDLGISEKKVTKEQKEKLEALYKKMNEEKEGVKSEGSEGKEGEGDKEKEGEDKKNILNVDEIDGQGQENSDENAWIDEYDQKLSTYAAANNNTWERDTAADENGEQPQGLKGHFGNGVEAHYTSKDSLAVQTPKDVAPTADHFKEIVELAKDQGQIINLGTQMRSEFRAALIEACAKGGVEIFNLTSEERETYNNLVAEQQAKEKTTEGEEKEGEKDSEKTAEGEGQKTEEKSEGENKAMTTLFNQMTKNAAVKAEDAELAAQGYSKLDAQIANYKKDGAEIGKDTPESKKLAMAEYAKMSVAEAQGKLDDAGKQKLADMKQVLAYYGLEISKETVDRGKNGKEEVSVVMNRDMGKRTPEEQQSIMEAVGRVQPKKQNMDLNHMSPKDIKDKTGGYVQ